MRRGFGRSFAVLLLFLIARASFASDEPLTIGTITIRTDDVFGEDESAALGAHRRLSRR